MARKERKLCRDRDKKNRSSRCAFRDPVLLRPPTELRLLREELMWGERAVWMKRAAAAVVVASVRMYKERRRAKEGKRTYTSQLLTRRRVASQAATAPSHSFAVSFLAPAAISIIAVIRLFLTKKGSNCVVGVVAVVPGHCQHFRAPFAALFGALQPAWMDSTSSGFLST